MKTTFEALMAKEGRTFLSSYAVNPRTGKKRGKGQIVLFALLAVYVVGFLGWTYGLLAKNLAPVFFMMDMGKQYFALLMLNALGLGFVFCTLIGYSLIYEAKDNELLLAMPIKPTYILYSRLVSCYLTAFVFELIALVPMYIFWVLAAGFEVVTLVKFIFVVFLLPLLSLFFSNIASYVIAALASKAKNRETVKIIMTIVFVFLYSFTYSLLMNSQAKILADPEGMANFMGGLSVFGLILSDAGLKGIAAFLVFAVATVALNWIEVRMLGNSFIRIATTRKSPKKKAYTDSMIGYTSLDKALLKKEYKHLRNNSLYLLNGIMGSIVMLIAGVVIFIKGRALAELTDMIPGFIGIALCAMSSMNIITEASVSLEGKSLWLLQSMPVLPWEALAAKAKMHEQLTIFPMVFLWISCCYAFRPSTGIMFTSIVMAVLFVRLMGYIGLAVDLRHGTTKWINVQYAIKQSMGVLIGLLISLGCAIVIVGGYFLFKRPDAELYNSVCIVLLVVATSLMRKHLTGKGAKQFAYFN